jgi:hypothetical protein
VTAVSPFDGANRIRFKGSPNGLSVPIEIGTPPKRIDCQCESDCRTRERVLQTSVARQSGLINQIGLGNPGWRSLRSLTLG